VPPSLLSDNNNTEPPRKMIPGAYEPNTLTHRQPGAMGGPPFRFSRYASRFEHDVSCNGR